MRSSVSRAYWSHADEESEDVCWEDEHEVNDDTNDVSDDAAYWCQSCGPDGEFGDVVDRMEQDIVCAFVAADCSLNDEDVCEDISECVHAECGAFFGHEQARQHGVHVEKVVHSFRPKSELEIKKRRELVEHAKRNSTCRTCGRKGHWLVINFVQISLTPLPQESSFSPVEEGSPWRVHVSTRTTVIVSNWRSMRWRVAPWARSFKFDTGHIQQTSARTLLWELRSGPFAPLRDFKPLDKAASSKHALCASVTVLEGRAFPGQRSVKK